MTAPFDDVTDPSPAKGVTFEEALEKTGNGVYNILLMVTCSLILLSIGLDLFGLSLLANAACDLNMSVAEKGILTSLPFVGVLISSYFWGCVSDKRGRRFSIFVSMLANFFLSSLCSICPNWQSVAVMRLISVCFSCASNSATYTIIGESCVRRVRNKYMMYMTAVILFAPALAAVVAYPLLKFSFKWPIYPGVYFSPWRLLNLIFCLPAGVGALSIYFFYESPKFLANIGKKDEALEVLRNIYAINNKCMKNAFEVKAIFVEEIQKPEKSVSFLRGIYEQSAPLFRRPLLFRTLQLFYITAIVYVTNNTFLVWLPYLLTLIQGSMGSPEAGNVCTIIRSVSSQAANSTENNTQICDESLSESTMHSLLLTHTLFTVITFLMSLLSKWRKGSVIATLLVSTVSGVLVNVVSDAIASLCFILMFTCTCLSIGALASYFVDLYPTSYRGMAACLSIMVGRGATFFGINLAGTLLFNYCEITFYVWPGLVFLSVIVSWFLPPDTPPKILVAKL